MIPISLTISGFLSYHEPVEINFTGFSLACIAGPNGAGKSAILDAITWALFGQARKRDESLINNQSDSAEVILIFEYEDNLYRVQRGNPRGKSTLLEFHIALKEGENHPDSDPSPPNPQHLSVSWKPLTERTLRDTQNRIEETLRLDYETFVNAAFFLQGKADLFTQQRPGDRKRILASILGLEIWETYRVRAAERRKGIESDLAGLDGRLAEINAELAEESARKERLEELQTGLESLSQARRAQETILENIRKIVATLSEQRRLVDTLARQLDSASQRQSVLENRLAARQEEKGSYAHLLDQADEIERNYQTYQETRQELGRWDDIAAKFREHETRRQEPLTQIETERARLSQELTTLKALESEIEAGKSKLDELNTQLETTQKDIKENEAQLSRREELGKELEAAREKLANAQAENPRLKAEMDELKGRIDQLTDTEGAACPLCGQPLSPEERGNLIDQLNVLGKTMGDRYRANKALLAEADQLVGDLQTQITELQTFDEALRTSTRNFDQLNDQIRGIETNQAEWEAQGAPRLDKIQHDLEAEDFAPEARAKLAIIDAELKEIGYDAASHDVVREAEAEGRAYDEAFRDLEKAQAALSPLESEIASLESQISELGEEIKRQQTEHDEAAAALAAAEAQAPDIHQAQSELLRLQEQENKMRMEVGAAQQKVDVLADLKQRRKAWEAERETLANRVGQYRQLERAFSKDGVPALLIEQALPQIETKANDILERLSGGNMSVRFETQRALKTRDDLRETLDIHISDSAGSRDYEMYSGGEAFRVNFAIRLALAEVLAQRAGARLQTLVIDEGFGSQDALGRQRLVEAINLVKADFAKILVITHIDELKDAFPARIEVEKTAQGSMVTVI
jgi:exonuclease SbcC